MQVESQDIKTLNGLQDVMYVKKWQQNGFYPIEKYIREKDGRWNIYIRKRNPETTETYFRKSLSKSDDAQFMFFLQHNYCLVSDSEMNDSDNFNFD